MIVNEDGYSYTVETAEGHKAFDIVFCRNKDGRFVDGVTNEELVNILVARMHHMVKQKPTQENMNALTHAQQTKQWIHTRSYNKQVHKRKNTLPNVNKGNGIQLPVKS
jgi:hypothetical protein